MQLLRRKKIRRDILMQYLARKSIPVVAGTDKVCYLMEYGERIGVGFEKIGFLYTLFLKNIENH